MTDELTKQLGEAMADRASDIVGDASIATTADAVGVPEATLRRVINGHGLPSLETAFLILRASGIDLIKVMAQNRNPYQK